MKLSLNNIEKLRFAGGDGEGFIGGSQEWFDTRWRRASGCGPVAAANLIWYAGAQRGGLPEYKELMRELYDIYSPRLRGVSSAAHFLRGLDEYGARHGLGITPKVLTIPAKWRKRPGIETVSDFIVSSVKSDVPVAFLNRSNGILEAPDNWHWVTVTAFDPEAVQAEVSDYGKVYDVDMLQWLNTSCLGGALVSFKRAAA